MKKKLFLLCLMIVVVYIISGCSTATEDQTIAALPEDEGFSIVATNFPAYDFARAVAGDWAEVTMLIPPGTEIHSFEPTPADIVTISHADIFFYIGGESESWVDSVLQSVDTSQTKVVRLIDAVKPINEETVEGMEAEKELDNAEGGTEYDEHIWTSPQNAVLMVGAIRDALCETDPDHATAYQDNAASYTAQINEIDEAIRKVVANAKREVLVFGDRFPFLYFVKEFGLTYRAAFPGCSSETETSAATMAYLINFVKSEKIPYIYYIEFSNENVAKSISEETGAGRLLLHSCHDVTKDDFDAGVTYVSLMWQNAENLKKGLN